MRKPQWVSPTSWHTNHTKGDHKSYQSPGGLSHFQVAKDQPACCRYPKISNSSSGNFYSEIHAIPKTEIESYLAYKTYRGIIMVQNKDSQRAEMLCISSYINLGKKKTRNENSKISFCKHENLKLFQCFQIFSKAFKFSETPAVNQKCEAPSNTPGSGNLIVLGQSPVPQ